MLSGLFRYLKNASEPVHHRTSYSWLYGTSTQGMLPPLVYRTSDGELVISNGVTGATRIAKLLPGTSIRVEVISALAVPGASMPTVGDKLS